MPLLLKCTHPERSEGSPYFARGAINAGVPHFAFEMWAFVKAHFDGTKRESSKVTRGGNEAQVTANV